MAINGTNGNDTIYGTRFSDEIFGLDGRDVIAPWTGADTIDGGENTDAVDYGHVRRIVPPGIAFGGAVDVDLQRSVQFGSFAEGDVLISIEDVNGSEENDVIKGDDGPNQLLGNGGDDVVEGRGGDDLLVGDEDPTAIFISSGVAGNDHLDGGQGNDVLLGGGGDDTLLGGLDSDQMFGEDGNDILFGDPGLDTLDGGAGTDTADYLGSASGVDIFLDIGIGFGGDVAGDALISIENLAGSNFSDTLRGTNVANVLTGRNGNDTLEGRGGSDTLNGGNGFDTATYAASAAGVVVDLTAGTGTGGDAQGDTLIAIENLIGSNSTDSLTGNSFGNTLDGRGSADIMAGRGGNDVYIVDNASDAVLENANEGTDEVRTSVSYALATNQSIETLRTTDEAGTTAINLTGNNLVNLIVGNNGDNVINGGGGADTLIGARGVDTMTGGSGGDLFVFRAANETAAAVATADTIFDFNPLAGDLIDLSGIDANIVAAGNQAFTFIGEAAFTGASGEVNVIHVNGDTIIQMQTGVEVDSDASIRIPGIVTLDASMFIL